MRTLLLCLLLVFSPWSFAAGSGAGEDAPTATARQLSRAVVAGIKIGLEAAESRGTIGPAMATCIRAIDDGALAPVYQRLMAERMTAAEIREVDAFYDSEAGDRYFRWSLNQLRQQQNLPITDPIDYGQEEQKRAEGFHATGAGRKLGELGTDSDAAGKQAIEEAIAAVLAPCR
jgi:hypothetical protein